MSVSGELIQYKMMPEWSFDSLPSGFRRPHNTKEGTWAKLNILSGRLQFDYVLENGEVVDTLIFDETSETPFIEPQQWHQVTPLTKDLRCVLSFYCQKSDYYNKKYQLTKTHSELLKAQPYLPKAGAVLDYGCGRGRNSLYMQGEGYEVDAVDISKESIDALNRIIADEGLQHINAQYADIRDYVIAKNYDVIISTVVLMFLEARHHDDVISRMQSATKAGGVNIVVCAIDDPVIERESLPFVDGIQPGQLLRQYEQAGWDIISYNENTGQVFRQDINGNPITLPFASLIAKKPSV